MNFLSRCENKVIFYDEYLNKRKLCKKQLSKLMYYWLFLVISVNTFYYFLDKGNIELTAIISLVFIVGMIFSCCFNIRKFMEYQQNLGYFTRQKLLTCNKNVYLQNKFRHEKAFNYVFILTFILGAALTITDIFYQYCL